MVVQKQERTERKRYCGGGAEVNKKKWSEVRREQEKLMWGEVGVVEDDGAKEENQEGKKKSRWLQMNHME